MLDEQVEPENLLDDHAKVSRKDILELGTGCALPSIGTEKLTGDAAGVDDFSKA